MFHKRCFVYLCYDFPIIVFYVSQALFCISLLWFPHNWYFMFHKRCFVYLCYEFPIIGILCLTSVVLFCIFVFRIVLYIPYMCYVFYVSQALFCISVLWFPYNWYFMSHKRCFVYLCYDFPIIGILCFTSVVLYICICVYSVVLCICVLLSL